MHSPWIRTKELHDSHVTSAQENGASCFGVKRHCVITKTLAHFSVQTGYPPDIMHDLFEGIVPVKLAQCLALLISKKYFSLQTLNKSILHFPYKWADKTNRPHVIPHTFSTWATIGGNAHDNWALIRLLPFIIGHLVPEGEMAWQILLDLWLLQHTQMSPLPILRAKFLSTDKSTKNSSLVFNCSQNIIIWSTILN